MKRARTGWEWWGRRWVRWTARGLCFGALAVLLGRGALGWVPMPTGLEDPAAEHPALELTDRGGQVLRVVGDPEVGMTRVLGESDVPETMVWATLAAEDARFFSHSGFDVRATGRALWQWVRHGRVVSGASTITQQLVKQGNPRPRTLRTKAVEWVQAARLEIEWDKQRILRAYLARIDYGNRAVGLASAARVYFGKHPADLDLAEAALLAGLPQAPGRLNPRSHWKRAKARQEWILGRCQALGWVDAERCRQAREEVLRLAPVAGSGRAPHFVDWVLSDSGVRPGRRATTLDAAVQTACEASVRHRLAALGGRRVRDASVVVLENSTGAVLAMVGSPDWQRPGDGQVNGALARRSPGSALKPFVYLRAFEGGAHASDVVADVPSMWPTPTGVFEPMNYDRHFRGPVCLREALGGSLNVPAVRVLERIGGPERLRETLEAFGVTGMDRDRERHGLGLVLGDAEVRMLELVNAYATLARLGEWRPVRVWMPPLEPVRESVRRVAQADACWLVANVLSDPLARAAEFGMGGPLNPGFRMACKTGTSAGFRDNWAMGFTPEFTVGVWVGNFDGSPMSGVSGVAGAGPILADVMEHLHRTRGTTWYTEPEGVRRFRVEPLTGRRRPSGEGREEVYLPGRQPGWEVTSDRDAMGRVRLGREYAGWYGTADQRLGGDVVLAGRGDDGIPVIVSPVTGTTYFLDGDHPMEGQRLVLRAETECQWHSDTLRMQQREGRVEVELVPGRHRIEARNRAGRAETWIEVRGL